MPSALLKPIYKNTIRYLGDAGVPWDILRRRRYTMESTRRIGTPVLIKHRYNIEDVEKGEAQLSSNYDPIYKQSIHDDPLSYGVGYVSTETTEEEWIVPGTERKRAELVVGEFQEGYEPAPTYRGYGPGYLTYVVLPDVPQDVFKVTDEGTFIKTEQARVQMPWWPIAGDEDLMIVCEINSSEQIVETFERYTLKQVKPITMRGRDRFGRRELGVKLTASGNRHVIGQYCEMALVPESDIIYDVEVDR